MMYKVRIINWLTLGGGEFGEFEHKWQADLQCLKYAIESDADRWDVSGNVWKAFINECDHEVLRMDVVKAESDE